ncbi:preprotein translocase subunit SecA [bacterium]|nr:preprotein translocase subunit SecA [bacterium]
MFNKILELFLGNKNEKDIKEMFPIVDEINREYSKLHNLSDDDLKSKTDEFRSRISAEVNDVRIKIEELKEKLKNPGDSIDSIDNVRMEIEKLEEKEKEITERALDEIMPEAFAVVKETCSRLVGKSWKVVGREIKWDMVPFDVQLMGAITLHKGKIAEMATGEGKTLVASMPLYLNALVGKGAHLVTVNDYLARRDCEWMGEIYKFLGLSVSYITNQMEPHERKKAYNADITYGTNNEFGFDYLRDNMSISPDSIVQRGHYYAIIDEVDSVLIDEARTPLIISGPVGETTNKFAELKPRVEDLVRKQTVLTNKLVAEAQELFKEEKDYEAGIKLLQAQRGSPKNKRLVKVLRESGMQRLVRKVESDFMRDKKLHELDVDLFFAIDEKAHTIDLTDKGRELLAPNNPDMFILPDLATELSILEETEEMPEADKEKKRDAIHSEYAEKSERLHNIHQLLRAYSLFEKDVEYVVTEDHKVMIVDEFTGRLMPGRRYSDGLHQALEAKESVKIEGETQTFATITLQNFFRLYKKLAGMTGTAETEAGEFWEIYKLDVVVVPTNEPVRRVDHDDVVYKTKREKFNAIIDEVEEYHSRKQPVLVGTISVEASETLSRMLRRRGIHHSVLNAKYHQKEAEIVEMAGEPGMVTIATNMAGRGTDIKLGEGVIQLQDECIKKTISKYVSSVNQGQVLFIHEVPEMEKPLVEEELKNAGLPYVVVNSKEEKREYLNQTEPESGKVVVVPKSLGDAVDTKTTNSKFIHFKSRDCGIGGLHIIGTERHESRRIDRQLRGRSGRQGDPGASKFFISLEDDLMRLFGSDRIAGLMDRMGIEEGDVITHPMMTKSIERAQKRVETRNFEIRKHLLEYDDVMNKQREVVYTWRRRALEGESLYADILDMIDDYAGEIVEKYKNDEESWDWEELNKELLTSLLVRLPVPEDEKDEISPDALRENISAAARDLYDKKRKVLGDDLMGYIEKVATLKTIDEMWKEHLYEMDQLKEGIGLRAYGQKDPLVEYKHEAFNAFTDMLDRANREILELVFKAHVEFEKEQSLESVLQPSPGVATVHEESSGMGFVTSMPDAGAQQHSQAGTKKAPVRVEHKVGRNDPCPCGSGKKYKYCCGRNL